MKNKDSIQSQGGKARAEKLTAEKKKEIASKAAAARWGDKTITALKKGSFKEHFGIEVDCYVLDDAHKTAVISQNGMARALGFSVPSGVQVTRFLANKSMKEFASAELIKKILQPIKFQWGTGGAEQPPSVGHGFDVSLLIDVCRAIVDAESAGRLGKRYDNIAAQAHVILGASAKAGIKGLVYALAGYNPSAEEVIKAFKTYVQEEARKYEKEFPAELYREWYRLYSIPTYERGRPWHFKQLTLNHVYFPLAQSNGKVLDLARAAKAKDGDRQKKLFQFLSEIGARALARQLGRVLEMAESSSSKADYESRIVERFGGQQEFSLTIPDAPEET